MSSLKDIFHLASNFLLVRADREENWQNPKKIPEGRIEIESRIHIHVLYVQTGR